MSYLTSHIYLMILLALVAITPIYNSIFRDSLIPRWYEWMLLICLSGLLLFELTNPSDKSGLGWIKIAVLLCGMIGVATHVVGWIFVLPKYWPTLMYCRNQCFALSFLLACVQILDFLSFHHLFGPWAIIIGDLMKDLGRFLAVLAIFVFGFSMHIVALNQPFRNINKAEDNKYARQARKRLFSDGECESIIMLPTITSSIKKFIHVCRSCVFIQILNVVLVAIIENLRLKRQAYDTQWQNTLTGESYRRKQGPTGRKSAYTRTRLYSLMLCAYECHFPYDDRITTRCACFTCYFLLQTIRASACKLQCLSHRECYHRRRYVTLH